MGNVSSGLGLILHPRKSIGFPEWRWAAHQSMSMWPVKRWTSVEVVREPLDTPRTAGGNFLAVSTEGSGTLANIFQSCSSRLLSCKAGTMYGSCNQGLGGVPYNFCPGILNSKKWRSS